MTTALEDVVAHVSDQAPVEPPVVETPPIDPNDLDAVEYAEALKAAEAEKTVPEDPNAEPAVPTAGEPSDKPATTVAPPAEEPDKGPVPMIPKPRFDEVLTKASEAERRIAYLEGQLDAVKSQPQAPAAPAAPAPAQLTPEQKLVRIGQLQDQLLEDFAQKESALAEKFDAGTLTYSQVKAEEKALRASLKAEERKLTHHEHLVREEMTLAKVPKSEAPKPQQSDDLYLADLTTQLETGHPWIFAFEKDHHFQMLEVEAKIALAEKGIQLDGSPTAKYRLMKEIAELSDTMGPRMFPDFKHPLLKDGQPPAAPAGPTGPSPAAVARASKIALQAGMPPDLTAVTGSGAAAQGEYSNAQISAMSDEDIAALPVGVRNKFLGLTSS